MSTAGTTAGMEEELSHFIERECCVIKIDYDLEDFINL
jgi:hypothetical protein